MVSIEGISGSDSSKVEQQKQAMLDKLLQKSLPVCTVPTDGDDEIEEDASESFLPLEAATLTEEQTRQLRQLYSGGGGASAKARAADYEKKTIAAKILQNITPVCTIAADEFEQDNADSNVVTEEKPNGIDATGTNPDPSTSSSHEIGTKDDHAEESSTANPPQQQQQQLRQRVDDDINSAPPDLEEEDDFPPELEPMMGRGPIADALYGNTTMADLEPYEIGTNAQQADQELAFLLDSLQIADPAVHSSDGDDDEVEAIPDDDELLAAMDELDINDDETLMALYAMMIQYEEEHQQKIQAQCMPCDVMPKLRFLGDNE